MRVRSHREEAKPLLLGTPARPVPRDLFTIAFVDRVAAQHFRPTHSIAVPPVGEERQCPLEQFPACVGLAPLR